MKPTTANQLRVCQLQKKVPELTDAQKIWATNNCFCINCIRHKSGDCFCLCCGHEFHTNEDDTLLIHTASSSEPVVICPHCGSKLHVKTSRKFKFSECGFMLLVTQIEEYMLVRRVDIRRRACLMHGKSYVDHQYCEVVQNWISPTGREHVCARSLQTSAFYYDNYNWNTELTLKMTLPKASYNFAPYQYRIYGPVYPCRKVSDIIRRNGYDGSFHNADPVNFIVNLLTSHELEFILKTKQFEFCQYFQNGDYGAAYVRDLKHVIKIYNRNHVKIKNAQELIDLCDALKRLGEDTHNPKNVLFRTSKQLHDAHQNANKRLMNRERVRREREEYQQRQQQLKTLISQKEANEAEYLKTYAVYLPIKFEDNNLHAHVLQSIDEFWDEAEAMHNCVFSNAYFKKANSIIMSVTDRESGSRLETCEISLTDFRILQCYGAHNVFTDRHEEIKAFIKANIYLIKKAKYEKAI